MDSSTKEVRAPRPSGNGKARGSAARSGIRKALPPAPPRGVASRGWLWLLVLGGAGFVGFRCYQNVQQKKAAAAAAQERRAAHRAVPVAAVPARARRSARVLCADSGTVDALQHRQREEPRGRPD